MKLIFSKTFLKCFGLILINLIITDLVLGQSNSIDYDNGEGADYEVGRPDPPDPPRRPQTNRVGPVSENIPALLSYTTQRPHYEVQTLPPSGPAMYPSSSFPGNISYSLLVDGAKCDRPCSSQPNSHLYCYFQFKLTHQDVLDPKYCGNCPTVREDCFNPGCIPADGVIRKVAVVNGKMPGPSIRVCKNDFVVVNVYNELKHGATIHWHGIHQKKSQYMDGVPHITQCPIPPEHSFRYEFQVPEAGSYFWHSHEGVQRGDGVYGSLIVRKPMEEEAHGPLNSRLYDYDLPEHEIIVMDWQNRATEDVLNDVILERTTSFRPSNILVNGMGYPHGFFNNSRTLPIPRAPMPLYEMNIHQGYAYRLRIIGNGITSCPIQISIESHMMTVIATDGFDIAPIQVDSLVIYAGERWDVVVKGTQRKGGSYWIKFRGLNYCFSGDTRVYQVGVLNYGGLPKGTTPGTLRNHYIKTHDQAKPPNGYKEINPLNSGPSIRPNRNVTAAELTSLHDDDPEIITREKVDHQFYLFYDFSPLSNINGTSNHPLTAVAMRANETFTPQINLITHIQPKVPPLTQPESIPSLFICNNTNDIFYISHPHKREKRQTNMGTGGDRNCTSRLCACTHLLQVKTDSIVEIILIDKGTPFPANHMFHLHGHSFRVVSMARLGRETTPEHVKMLNDWNLIGRRRSNAPIKDTVAVPSGGYTIIRFRANNPGFWYFHCHIEFHAEVGMGLIFQVGDLDEMPKIPKNFPKCGAIPAQSLPETTTTTKTTTTEDSLEELQPLQNPESDEQQTQYSSLFHVPSSHHLRYWQTPQYSGSYVINGKR